MRYFRKPMTVDAVKLSFSCDIDGIPAHAGDFLVTFEDGSQTVLEGPVFEATFEEALQNPPGPVEAPQRVIRPTIGETRPVDVENVDEYTCIECGATVNRANYDSGSGRCRGCIQVRCPTCKKPAKLSEMAGEYCPSCLPALAGRRDR